MIAPADRGLTASVIGDVLTITIGVNALADAATGSDTPVVVHDPHAFARACAKATGASSSWSENESIVEHFLGEVILDVAESGDSSCDIEDSE